MTTTRSTRTRSSSNGKAEEVGVNVKLPAALHRELRVKCVNTGQSLTEAVTAAVKAYVKR